MDRRILRTVVAFLALGVMLCAVMACVAGQAVHHAEAEQMAVLHRDQEIAQQQVQKLQERVVEAERQKQMLDKQIKSLQAQNRDQQSKLTSVLSSRAGSPLAHITFGAWQSFTASWYSPQGGVGNGLTTATGAHVANNIIAVDPRVIPLGSLVQIKYPDGHMEIKRAADTGGAIRGHRVDIFNWSESYCMSHGVQHVQIRVLGRG